MTVVITDIDRFL